MTIAVPASRVLEVVPRVLLAPLPGAPSKVEGVFSHRGELTVVVDLRREFGVQPGTPALTDQLLVVRTERRVAALLVDRVVDLVELDEQKLMHAPLPSPLLAGVIALEDGLLLVHDLDAALSLDDDRHIDRALEIARA